MNETMTQEKEQKTYELALLLKNEDDLTGVLALIREYRGDLLAEPRAKRVALAYKIKGNADAVFATLTFKALGADAKELERELLVRDAVIRSMIIVSPPQSERQPGAMPSFAAQKRVRAVGMKSAAGEPRSVPPRPLSNEALEKKIEEISQ